MESLKKGFSVDNNLKITDNPKVSQAVTAAVSDYDLIVRLKAAAVDAAIIKAFQDEILSK